MYLIPVATCLKWNKLGKQLQKGADGQNMPKFKKYKLRNCHFLLICNYFFKIHLFVFCLRQDKLVQNNQNMIKWILKKNHIDKKLNFFDNDLSFWKTQACKNKNYPSKSVSTYLCQRTYINIHSLCKWYWGLHYWSDSIIVWYLVMHWLWRSEFWTRTKTIIGPIFLNTPAIAKIISVKNARAWVSMVSYLKK